MPGIQEITQSLGLDFSAESKGKFKGLEAVVYQLNGNHAVGNIDLVGGVGTPRFIQTNTVEATVDGAIPTTPNIDHTTIDGVFHIKSMGRWLVFIFGQAFIASNNVDRGVGFRIHSSDNGPSGTFTICGENISSIVSNASTAYGSTSTIGLFNVKNITDYAIKFVFGCSNPTYTAAGAQTHCIFIKLADN